MGGRWWVVAALAALGVAAGACSERNDSPGSRPSPTADLTGGLLSAAGRAMDAATSYRLTVSEENFVLERWGGSDGGTVQIDLKSSAAVADLRRTGDGQYAIVLHNGETYFKRETCPTWAKIQAGQGVLAPFVITGAELRSSKLIESLPPASATSTRARVELTGVGQVTLEIETATARPLRITSDTLTNNGKPLEWSFSAWGEKVSVPETATDRLSGPGGNPC